MNFKKCVVVLMSILMIFCLGGVIYGAEATLKSEHVKMTPRLTVFNYRTNDHLKVNLKAEVITEVPVTVKFVLKLDMRRCFRRGI